MPTAIQALPVNSVPPQDWWRRVSTTVNYLVGSVAAVYQRTTTIVNTAGAYAVTADDYLLAIDSTAGAVSVTLPAPTKGRELVAKRLNAGANAITLNGQVDNFTSVTLAGQWSALSLIGGTDRWLIVSKYVP